MNSVFSLLSLIVCAFRFSFSNTPLSLPAFFFHKNLGHTPLGWPAPDLNVLVVDEDGNRLPPGETGELVLHSRTVARGYWKQPELTRQKFRPDPERDGWFYYHTGDLGRISHDGCVYHRGRIDSQVKIRGQRVELAEIESVLLALDNIDNAVVGVHGDAASGQRLAAWVVWTDPARPMAVSALRRRLAHRVPAYMVPTHFMALDRLPLNGNGKVDRQRLPDPDGTRSALDVAFVPPQTPLERELARIWTTVLGVAPIGVQDDFFDLGGDSIQAMRILAQLQDVVPVSMQLQTFYEVPTIAQMALYLLSVYGEDDSKGEKYGQEDLQ